jgi:hypothetical protein
MDSEIESLKAEVARLGGETVALQIILGRLLDMLVRSGQVSSGLITQIFAQADLAAETAVLRSKDASIPSHTETTFKVLAFLRQQVLGADPLPTPPSTKP